MFTIKLYKFNKKPNSTAVPAVAGTSYSCTMKTVSSLLSPVIDIADTKQTGAIPLFNYAYIADFDRYYFIDDVSWSQGIWSLSMHVDVLASFKEDIENSRQYVIRSASRSNPYIPDTVYQTYIDTSGSYAVEALANSVQRYNSTTRNWENVSYFNRSVSSGAVCVGIVSGAANGVTHYIMPVSTFQELLHKAFAVVPSDMTDVSSGLANAIFDPVQYITYCRWFPVLPLSANLGTMVHTVNIGGYSITFTAVDSFCYQMNGLGVEKYRFNIDLPFHPDAVTYPYTRLSPFSEYSLNFQPFGNIPLDTTKMMDASRLTVQWSVDFCTGQCILEVRSNAAHRGLIYTETADYGVPMPISALVVDWKAGLAMSGLTWLKSTSLGQQKTVYTDYLNPTTTPSGRTAYPAVTIDNTKIIDQMMDVVGASMGNVVTKGSSGSFLSYNAGVPYIYLWYVKQADHDNARYGAPLCKEVRLDSLSGFCICSNATVAFSVKYPMSDEYAAICTYLNSGVYLE